ncbi:MAG: sigma-70 family RNA polymerase sigma factor [Bacteroidota bacterium]
MYKDNCLEEDIILIRKILNGESIAFRSIIEKYKNLVYFLILKMINNREEADDLAQDVFFKVYKNLSKYKLEYSFRNWIYTITLNLIRNYIKRKNIISFLSLSSILEKGEININRQSEDNNETDQKQCEDNELVKKIFILLSGRQKEIFILHYLKNISCRDIAKITKLSEANVKVILHRMRKLIYNRLKDEVNCKNYL